MNHEEILKQYADELNISPDFLTLEKLIESHRHLRSLNKEFLKTRRELLAQLRAEAFEQISKEALEDNYISIEKLKSMTISELVELLRED